MEGAAFRRRFSGSGKRVSVGCHRPHGHGVLRYFHCRQELGAPGSDVCHQIGESQVIHAGAQEAPGGTRRVEQICQGNRLHQQAVQGEQSRERYPYIRYGGAFSGKIRQCAEGDGQDFQEDTQLVSGHQRSREFRNLCTELRLLSVSDVSGYKGGAERIGFRAVCRAGGRVFRLFRYGEPFPDEPESLLRFRQLYQGVPGGEG